MIHSITSIYPSAILADFHTYIDYCEQYRPKVTTKSEFLNRKGLVSLNEQMLQKDLNVTARSDQHFYLQLHLFQYLCLEGRLFKINREKTTTYYFEAQSEKLSYFRQLNSTEQYFYLFKTLWCYCNWTSLQIKPSRIYSPTPIHALFSQIAESSSDTFPLGKNVNKKNYLLNMIGQELGISLFHLQLFGFWQCQWKEGEYYREKTRPQVAAVSTTNFGKNMAAIIAVHGKLGRWNKYYQNDVDLGDFFTVDLGIEQLLKTGKSKEEATKIAEEKLEAENQAQKEIPFEVSFQALFPEKELGSIEVRPPNRFTSGTYLFKVNLTRQKGIWRRIQLGAIHTLEDLHYMILNAFDLDDDHLYAFYMDGKRFSELSYNSPNGDERPFSDEVELGACEELEINRKILYLYDFGTESHFDVVLESIDEEALPLKEGNIIESRGDAPKRYSDWE